MPDRHKRFQVLTVKKNLYRKPVMKLQQWAKDTHIHHFRRQTGSENDE